MGKVGRYYPALTGVRAGDDIATIMRLSHDHRFVFLSNPKCASTTVRSLLDPYANVFSTKSYGRAVAKQLLTRRNFMSRSSRKRTIASAWKYLLSGPGACNPFQNHVNALTLKQHFDAMGWEWKDYYSFTLIRNPWDRLVSCYEYGRKNERSVWHEYARGDTFRNFVYRKEVVSLAARYSYDQFVLDEAGSCLLNQVIRVEDVSEELPRLLQRLGLDGPQVIPKINATERSDYRPYYDEETADRVRAIFRSDIEVGRYSF